MVGEEEKRAEYGVDDNDVKFSKDDAENWLNVDSSYAALQEQPINKVLTDFRKEYIKNERLTYDMFVQMRGLLDEFITLLNNNPFYREMEIIRLVENLLDKYKNWMTTMRYNVLLGKEKMIEVEDYIKAQYIPNHVLNDRMDEASERLKESEADFWETDCVEMDDTKVFIVHPAAPIGIGDWARWKKIDTPPTAKNMTTKIKNKEKARKETQNDENK